MSLPNPDEELSPAQFPSERITLPSPNSITDPLWEDCEVSGGKSRLTNDRGSHIVFKNKCTWYLTTLIRDHLWPLIVDRFRPTCDGPPGGEAWPILISAGETRNGADISGR